MGTTKLWNPTQGGEIREFSGLPNSLFSLGALNLFPLSFPLLREHILFRTASETGTKIE